MKIRHGFGLIEGLVCVAIIATLAAILVPAWEKARAPRAFILIERKAGNPPNPFGLGRCTLDVEVLVNNEKVGSLSNGQRQKFAFPIEPGQNTIQLKFGRDISPVVRFESEPGRSIQFVCKYLDDNEPSGYAMTLRPAADDETRSAVVSPVTVESIQYDPLLTHELFDKYPPMVVHKGSQLSFKRTEIATEHVEIVDVITNTTNVSPSLSLSALIGPIEVGIHNIGGGTQSETHGIATKKDHASVDSKELIIQGDDKPVVIEKWRSYRTGTAQVLVKGRATAVKFRYPVEEYYR